MRRSTPFILQLILFLIPQTIHIIGDGVRIAWPLFSYQITSYGDSYISSELDYILFIKILTRGSIIPISLWNIGGALLIFATLLLFYNYRKKEPEYQKTAGIFTILAGILFFLSGIFQYGILLKSVEGEVIPIGIPVTILTGWWIFQDAKNDGRNIPLRHIFWKALSLFLCGILILWTVYSLSYILSTPSQGWDLRVYTEAVHAYTHMQSPYVLENINSYVAENLPFTYPPHTLIIFAFFFIFNTVWIYYGIVIILMLISSYLVLTIDQSRHYLFFTTLLLTGFNSTYWIFLTGNFNIYCLFLLAVSMYLLVKNHFNTTSIIIGFLSSISLFPIAFSAIFLAVPQPLMKKLRLICQSFGIFLGIFALTYIANPPLMVSYIQFLTSPISPIHASGGMDNPTPYLMIGAIANSLHLEGIIILFLLWLVYIGLVIAAAYHFVVKNDGKMIKIYSFIFLTIFLILPRTMPYYFLMLTVPLYFLLKEYSYKVKSMVLCVISLFPTVVYWNFWLNPQLLPDIVYLYSQAMSVLLVFTFIFFYDRYAVIANNSHE